MTPTDKWNTIYKERDIGDTSPAQVLQRNKHLLPAKGLALDVASGLGVNAIDMARCGLHVDALDISPIACKKLQYYADENRLPIHSQCVDLELWQGDKEKYDVILVSHYLQRGLETTLIKSLKPGGLLFYQTYTIDKPEGLGPSNPAFLLKVNELLEMFDCLQIHYYREDGQHGDLNQGDQGVAMLVAAKRT